MHALKMRALRPLRETTYLRVQVHVTAYVAPAVADAPQRYIRHAHVPVCVVPEPGACSASHELPSRYDAPNTCTVHVVMHSQLRWRARAHGADGQRSGCDVWEVGVCRLTFLPFASAPADGVVRAPVSAACVWALRTCFGNAHDALGAARMRRKRRWGRQHV